MSSRQGESFQEIIQRYNRELMKLQRKAVSVEESAVASEAAPPAHPAVPTESPSSFEENGIEIEGETVLPTAPVPFAPEEDYVDYMPGPLGIPECENPSGPDAGQIPVPLPDDIPVEGGGEESKPDQGELIPPPDISRCEDRNTLHSQTVGATGPVLLQDGILHETLETFISGTRLSRPLHKKGWGAMGSFRCYRSMKAYTSAAFLGEPNTVTPVAVRFSQASGNVGAPDTTRNIRGFATRFYTQEGNFDLVGNNIPVFFIRDAIRFPEVAAALSPSPVTNLSDPERLWAFLARTPEAVNMITWYYSDVGTVRSYRMMRGYGVNTFVWKNADGVRKYVKYHWLPMAGEQYVDREEAERMRVAPDVLGRDLYETIAKGEKVEYELNIQLMEPEDVHKLSFDPLDDTKIWDEKLYPLMPVGCMVLDKNPENYLEQVEKLAFSPANLVEGIELSDDKMLQGRSFIYWDSQRRRLGTDFREIPVNRQKNGAWTPASIVTSGEGVCACGDQLREEIHNPDNFTQAGERYRAMDAGWKERLVDNIAAELYQMSGMIQSCIVGYLYQADPEFGSRVQQMVESYMKRR